MRIHGTEDGQRKGDLLGIRRDAQGRQDEGADIEI